MTLIPANHTLPALYANEDSDADNTLVYVRLFSPNGSEWYLTEYDPTNHLAFGYAYISGGYPELGYISIAEMEALNAARAVPAIERDMYFTPCTLTEAMERVNATA